MHKFFEDNDNKIIVGAIVIFLLMMIGYFTYIQLNESVVKENEILTTPINTEENIIDKTVDSEEKLIEIPQKIPKNIINEEFTENIDIEKNINDKIIEKTIIKKDYDVDFNVGTYLNPNNDFKTRISLKFSSNFFKDIGEKDSKEYLANRLKEKNRLIDLLKIEPKIEVNGEDIYFTSTKNIILYLSLDENTAYNLKLKQHETELIKSSSKSFNLKTPDNKVFSLQRKKTVSLFKDTTPPKIELISFNSGKNKTKIKLCRINTETYAKIEVFNETKGLELEKQEFNKKGIDKLDVYGCKQKEINITQYSNAKLSKTEITFDDLIGKVARSGLYYVTFSDQADREFNNKIQKPIFFGIIDSHITMKVSKSGEAFFFVNDFDGKPLANQNIKVYVNNFNSKETNRDRNSKSYYETYFSPLEKDVLNEAIYLGITGRDGVLKVNLKGKIEGFFNKTFDNFSYDRRGNLDGFFITSASKTNLSYVSSKWNGGLSPWNFGYTVSSGWWWNPISENSDEISLERWGSNEAEIYSHIYTDRKLYLPGEKVYIKGVLRNSKDLSIPKDKKITVKITDSQNNELSNTQIKVNEFGSISTELDLKKTSKLGSYNILFSYNSEIIGTSGFSVEVFKNPKFKNEVMLETIGLNNSDVNIIKTDKETTYRGYERETYKGKFDIKATILSKYYSGSPVKNANFTYKVYKQYYYDDAFWNDCYYGCYWEPQKEFYTEGKGILDNSGKANVNIPVEFSSRYNDYKYIVEVTVEDSIQDKISGSNSIVAKLPSIYKRRDPNSGVYFKTEKRFYKSGENITIEGGLTAGKFSKDYNDKFLLIVKKKDYKNKIVNDVRGYSKTISTAVEKIEKIIKVNDNNFNLTSDGKLKFNHKISETGEYIFEFGKINNKLLFDIDDLISEFKTGKEQNIYKTFKGTIKVNRDNIYALQDNCNKEKNSCKQKDLLYMLGCAKGYLTNECRNKFYNIKLEQKIKIDDLIDSDSRKYFTIVGYGNKKASNPIENDNKITVLSEKVSYKLGEKARVLVRLPFSKGKILWTIEKQGVLKHEYIDIVGNTFFKEFIVDDTFLPNAYIGVLVVDTNKEKIPEYKVGYTEIVVDKTDKKTFIDIKANKGEYKPRDEVVLNLKVTNNKKIGKKSELTVMVVDDSLISLMGNVDLNTLEKFYKKLPFQIQTSITNVAMLKNYYFSRQGIVGGSGAGGFKGGDSAVSSRNIFKNTAYYNPSVITDSYGNAKVKFELPDNLTNFRVMVIANSKDNFFGYNEDYIEVRKQVLVEPRTPLIVRGGDELEFSANVFNNTDKQISFKANIDSKELNISEKQKYFNIGAGNNNIVKWKVSIPKELALEEINYKITVLGDSADHSDKIEGKVKIKQSPALITNNSKSENISEGQIKDLSIVLGNNTDILKSNYELYISTNPLAGIEQILSSLAKYPYGCVEQTTSSTMPNAILKKFSNLKIKTGVKNEELDKNIAYGIERLASMQNKNGGFSYWQSDHNVNDTITPYVTRSLIEIKEVGGKIPDLMINNAVSYLESIYNKTTNNKKSEILWTLAKNYNNKNIIKNIGIQNLTDDFDFTKMQTYELIAHTYAMILTDKIKYKFHIINNIEKIKKMLNSTYTKSYYYSNNMQNKAIFAQLLLDYNYDNNYSFSLIKQLYNNDWSSYYYSTKTKNEVFKSFVKYIQIASKGNTTKVEFILNGESRVLELNSDISYRKTVSLNKVLKGDKIDLKIENIKGNPIFVTSNIISYPKDITRIPYSGNKMDIKREIFEVSDEKYLKDTCNRTYSSEVCIPAKGLEKHSSDIFKKGATYKVKITANLNNTNRIKNFVIEDYLPAGFTVINSKFKTSTIATKQNTTKSGWRWDYSESKPGVVMAHAKNIWGNIATYEYFVRADFSGKFTYPPSTGYMMYDPKTRANTKYREIEIR